MKQTIWMRWATGGALAALLLAGCGGGEEAAPTGAATASATPTAAVNTPTAAATSTAVPTRDSAAAQQDSPLAAPDSPLSQPASPLPADASAGTEAETEAGTASQGTGPHIDIAVPSDINVITQLAQETKAPTPKEGMASLSGVLYAPGVNRIIPGTQYYLTPAIEDNGQFYIPTIFVGPKPEHGDVGGRSNEKGQMLLDNVPPGNYYLAVWAIYNWPLAFGGATDERPLLITVKAGEQRDLGLLYVPEWP